MRPFARWNQVIFNNSTQFEIKLSKIRQSSIIPECEIKPKVATTDVCAWQNSGRRKASTAVPIRDLVRSGVDATQPRAR
jgi:hypothetical protein